MNVSHHGQNELALGAPVHQHGDISIVKGDHWLETGIFVVLMAMNGSMSFWNEGLESGVGGFAISIILMTICYACLVLSLAEMNSSLSFAGGSYTIIRCTVGFFPGYLYGIFQLLAYIGLSSSIAYSMSSSIVLAWALSSRLQPVFVVSILVTSAVCCSVNRRVFNRAITVMTSFALIIAVIFVIGAFPHVDINRYGVLKHSHNNGASRWFPGGMMAFMRYSPMSAWFFLGIESITSRSMEMVAPKENVWKSFAFSYTTLFVLCWLIFPVASSLPPSDSGLDRFEYSYPLYAGYHEPFRTSRTSFTAIMIVVQTGSVICFLKSFSRVFHAMAISNVVPRFLTGHVDSRDSSSRAGLIVASIATLLCCMLMWVSPGLICVVSTLSILLSMVNNFLSGWAYRVMKAKFANITRNFSSPLGQSCSQTSTTLV